MTATVLQCDREALKPCPFCGGEAEIRGLVSTEIRCTNDQCIIGDPAPFNDFSHRHDAITAWNTRHDSTREMAEAMELLRQAMNALGTVDNNDPLEPIADNGMTVWDGMRGESLRLWPHYRTFLATLQGTDR